MLSEIGSCSTSGFGKNLFCVLMLFSLLGGVGFGIYLIHQGQIDEHSSEVEELNSVIDFWINSTFPVFNTLEFTAIVNNSDIPLTKEFTADWPEDSEEIEAYTGIKYITNSTLLYAEDLTMHNSTHEKEYTLEGALTVVVSPSTPLILEGVTALKRVWYNSNQKMCDMHGQGCWDLEEHHCYRHYTLHTLCVLFDEETSELATDYADGCFGGGMESFELLPWTNCSAEPVYSGTVELSIRSVNDPYVVAVKEDIDELSPSATTYIVLGILAIVGSVILLAIPGIFFLYKPRSALLQGIEVRRY